MATQPSQPTRDDVPSRLEVTGPDERHRTRCRFCGGQLRDHDRTKRFPDDGPAGSWCYEYECPDETELLVWSMTHRPHLHE